LRFQSAPLFSQRESRMQSLSLKKSWRKSATSHDYPDVHKMNSDWSEADASPGMRIADLKFQVLIPNSAIYNPQFK